MERWKRNAISLAMVGAAFACFNEQLSGLCSVLLVSSFCVWMVDAED